MKNILIILTLISLLSCTDSNNSSNTKVQESISYKKHESSYEILEEVSIKIDGYTSSSNMLSNIYYIYTEKTTKKQRCQESFQNHSVSVPVDYCVALLTRIKQELPNTRK